VDEIPKMRLFALIFFFPFSLDFSTEKKSDLNPIKSGRFNHLMNPNTGNEGSKTPHSTVFAKTLILAN
jgi:hypothetical protein